MLRATFFTLIGTAFFAHWVITDPSFEGPVSQQWPHVLGFSGAILTLAFALPVFGRMLGGRWVLRLAFMGAAGAALGSVGNIVEDGLQMDWAFWSVILSLLIIELALLGLTAVIGLTGRGGHRLLALVPAGTLAAIIFYVWAGGVIMLATWLAAATVALALPMRPAGLTAPTSP